MNLKQFEGKRVRLTTTDRDMIVGQVTDYIYPEDNEPEGIESIIVRAEATNQLVEFYANEIKSIEVI